MVICTDGDVDGFQIRTLILTMLYRLCPTLIREGYVYIAETPLFEITYKDKTGKRRGSPILKRRRRTSSRSLEGKKVQDRPLQGSWRERPGDDVADHHEPGDPPSHQGACPRTWSETARVFDLLLGDNLSGRKEYIAENGHKYMDMIDVS